MPQRTLALLASSFFLLASAHATEPEKPKPTPQQQRMKDCHASAKEKALKGDPRRQFMSQCLKGKAVR